MAGDSPNIADWIMAGGTIAALLVSAYAVWQSSASGRESMRDRLLLVLEDQLRLQRQQLQRLTELRQRTEADKQPLYVILKRQRDLAQSMLEQAQTAVKETSALHEAIVFSSGRTLTNEMKRWRVALAQTHALDMQHDLQIETLAAEVEDRIRAWGDGSFHRQSTPLPTWTKS